MSIQFGKEWIKMWKKKCVVIVVDFFEQKYRPFKLNFC